MKFGVILLHVNTHRLTASDLWYDVILRIVISRNRPCCGQCGAAAAAAAAVAVRNQSAAACVWRHWHSQFLIHSSFILVRITLANVDQCYHSFTAAFSDELWMKWNKIYRISLNILLHYLAKFGRSFIIYISSSHSVQKWCKIINCKYLLDGQLSFICMCNRFHILQQCVQNIPTQHAHVLCVTRCSVSCQALTQNITLTSKRRQQHSVTLTRNYSNAVHVHMHVYFTR